MAVDVCLADVIEVNERKSAHARAGEGLDDPGPDAAETDDHDMAVGKFLQSGNSIEAGDSTKAGEEVISHGP